MPSPGLHLLTAARTSLTLRSAREVIAKREGPSGCHCVSIHESMLGHHTPHRNGTIRSLFLFLFLCPSPLLSLLLCSPSPKAQLTSHRVRASSVTGIVLPPTPASPPTRHLHWHRRQRRRALRAVHARRTSPAPCTRARRTISASRRAPGRD
ncbi:hypothetical protein DFH08DRAFT_875364 [Mycena albidolilacea]|uniref:Uncharacterized protein n=1 Tax=Mycena albidolilacea TaxID=1033008 RepID=A0AAD7EPN5_9AGAR|nr:hypothetical protein DFH08DRAFT_875364 [Mycena albidolilacea]